MSAPIKRGLSRSLDSLLSDRAKNLTQQIATARRPEVAASGSNGELHQLKVEHLQAGQYQPRQHFDQASLEELAHSIGSQGIIEPLIVRAVGINRYEIIVGERRWRAARVAGLTTVPAIVRDLSNQATLAVALVENLQRQDLNVLEEALGLQRLMDEFKLTQAEVGSMVGKNRTTISNLLRLLKLNSEVKALLQNSTLEMGHARALLALSGVQQTQAANDIIARKLSVRETEQLVKQLLKTPRATDLPVKVYRGTQVAYLENDLSKKLGAPVLIQHNRSGKGKLEIHYASLEALDAILMHIN